MNKLSILIPAFNEEATIDEIISKVKKLKLPIKTAKEIIVINDASSDKTLSILKKLKGIKVYSHKTNQGKGAAITTGFKKAGGDVIVIQDADLEYDPKYIPALYNTLISKKADVVYGSRLKDYPLRIAGSKKTPLILHYIGNKFLSLITRVLYRTEVTDMETGYKMFRKSVVKDLNINARRFELEPEITAKILKKGIEIVEIPIRTKPRGYDEGKKITWKDGFLALWTLIKYRFTD